MEGESDNGGLTPADELQELRRCEMIRLTSAKFPDLQAKGIEEGWDQKKIELEVFRASLPRGPAIRSGGPDPGEMPQILQASICSRLCGEQFTGQHFDSRTMNIALARENRNLGFHDLLRGTIAAAGQPVPSRIDNAAIRTAFECDRMLRASGIGFSTTSLAGVLGPLVNKVLLNAFGAVQVTWRAVARVGSSTNLHPQNRYSMDVSGAFQDIAPTGEIKHISLGEVPYAFSMGTKGSVVQISRTDLINDNLGAINDLPKAFGRYGALALEKAVYLAILGNAGNFFHANNANLITGATTVLSLAGLTTGEAAMRSQLSAAKDPLYISPKTLVVPPALATTGAQLMSSELILATATATGVPSGNPMRGRFDLQISPYLAVAAGIANASDTAWFLFGDPNDVAALEVAFLNGIEAPIVESGEPDFDSLGMAMRTYFDFGVGLLNPKAALKSAGA